MRAKMGAKEKNVNGLQGQWPGTAPCVLVPAKGAYLTSIPTAWNWRNDNLPYCC